MSVRTIVCAAVAAAMLAAAAVANAQGREKDAPQAGAYNKLDSLRMHNMLQELGMWEVETYHMKAIENQGGEQVIRIQIQGLRRRAELWEDYSAAGKKARRETLNEAIALQQKYIAIVAKRATDPLGKIALLEAEFDLVVIAGLERVEVPYATPVAYLQGTEQDRRDTAKLTARAAGMLLNIQNQAQRYLDQWNSLEDQVRTRPRLDRLQRRLVVQGMWIFLYRGMTVDDPREARQWLTQATGLASKAIEQQIDVYRGHLVYGMASRMLGNYPAALAHLKRVADAAEAPAAEKLHALFEIPRALAEQGDEAGALVAVQQFYAKSIALIDAMKAKATTDKAKEKIEGYKLGQEISAAILRSEVYDAASRRAKDAVVKAEKKRQAMFALVDFVNAKAGNPSVQSAMFRIIVYKYAGGIDIDKPETLKGANSVVLMALAVVDQGLWADETVPEGQRNEMLDRAETALIEITKRTDVVSKRMRPDALWYLALAVNQKFQTQRAGQLFTQIAKEYPANALAPKAAYFAVRTYAALIYDRSHRDSEGKTRVIGNPMRAEYINALARLLTNDKWVREMSQLLAGDPEATAEKIRQRYWDLGWQIERLASVTRDPKKKLALQAKAVQAYHRVPEADIQRYMSGMHSALNMEVEILRARMDAGDKSISKDSSELLTRLQAYIRRAIETAEKVKTSDKKFHDDLRQWGAYEAFNKAVVRYEFLNDTGRALDDLDRLPKEWPGTFVIEEAKAFEIRTLIEKGQIKQSLEKLKAFDKEFAGRSRALIDLLITNIKKKIEQIEHSSVEDKAARLRNLQQSYANLAKMLYDQTVADPASKADEARKLSIRKLYGDALIKVGKYQQALDQFTECHKVEEVTRDAEKATIDVKWKAVHGEAEAAAKVSPKALADHIRKMIEAAPPEEFENSSLAREVKRMLDYLDAMIKKGHAEGIKKAVARTIQANKAWTEGQAKDETLTVPEDLNTLRGLARAQVGLKKYEQGVKIFKRIAWLIDASNPEYWQAQLDFCKASFQANAKKPAILEELLNNIGDLRDQDPEFGGLYPEFNLLEANIRRRAG